jgi:hypothetical protein
MNGIADVGAAGANRRLEEQLLDPRRGCPMTGQLSRALMLEIPAGFMDRLRAGRDVRIAKVLEVRRRIRLGTYETPLKLSIAVNRMLEGSAGPVRNP